MSSVPRIRPAEPSDAPFLAEAMQNAARSHLRRGYWDLLFPDEGVRLALLEALALHPAACHCHHGGFLLAELDGEPVGSISGFEPLLKTEERFHRAMVESAARLGLDDAALREADVRGVPFLLCRPEFPDDCFVVEWVYVLPGFRGRGVVDALLDAIMAEGRRLGYDQAQLGYLLGNERAERCYLRHGFQVVAARTHPSMDRELGSSGVGRMRAAL